MLDAVFGSLRAGAGITPVHDFGLLHEAPVGFATNRVSASLEYWDGLYWFSVRGEISRGHGFRKTRVVKWPYGRQHPKDGLDAVIADLDAVAGLPGSVPVADSRTFWGRCFDGLIRREFLGVYRFASPIPREAGFRIEAEISRRNETPHVILSERAPGRGFILLHLPQPVFLSLSAAVRSF